MRAIPQKRITQAQKREEELYWRAVNYLARDPRDPETRDPANLGDRGAAHRPAILAILAYVFDTTRDNVLADVQKHERMFADLGLRDPVDPQDRADS